MFATHAGTLQETADITPFVPPGRRFLAANPITGNIMRILFPTLGLAMALVACGTPSAPSASEPKAAPKAAEQPKANAKAPSEAAPKAIKEPTKAKNDAQTCGETRSVVSLTTSDGVTLAADFLPASGPQRGAVILLHMIPPRFERSSYPDRVLEAIAAQGLNVLNVDRRGAGESKGNPKEAYKGPGGRLDVEAAVEFLTKRQGACKVDTSKLVIVGASNGTTSALDYALGHAEALPDPKALVFLSPGTYTEGQHPIKDHRAKLDPLPILWIHPDKEPYSQRFAKETPAAWRIVTLKDGEHGTRNFDKGPLEERQLGEILGWLKSHTGQP